MKGNLPSLVEIDEENNIISETGKSMCCRHGDNEGKYIIYECIKSLKMKKIPIFDDKYAQSS